MFSIIYQEKFSQQMNEHRLFAIQKHRKDLIISKSLKYNTVYHFKISKNKFQRFRILKWNKISRSVTQFKNISSFISTYFALKTSFYFLLELWALHCTITEETNTGACGALECTFSSAGALLVGGGSDFCGGWGGEVQCVSLDPSSAGGIVCQKERKLLRPVFCCVVSLFNVPLLQLCICSLDVFLNTLSP